MSPIKKIKKRDGALVDFTPEKIGIAIQKAFADARANFDLEKIMALTEHVITNIEKIFTEETPAVENVQDFVERELMQEGYFDVAKSYILYRYEHAKERAE